MAKKPIALAEAVEIVALNDEPTLLKVDDVVGQPSVMVVAHIYGLTQLGVARKVVAFRKANQNL